MVRYRGQNIDKHGYTTFQMHELMYCFGHMTYNGSQTPFDTDIIIDVDINAVIYKWENYNGNRLAIFTGSGFGKRIITTVSNMDTAIKVCNELNEDCI